MRLSVCFVLILLNFIRSLLRNQTVCQNCGGYKLIGIVSSLFTKIEQTPGLLFAFGLAKSNRQKRAKKIKNIHIIIPPPKNCHLTTSVVPLTYTDL